METGMSFLVIEVYAPTKKLRDTALARARKIMEATKKLHIISVGRREDNGEYFFSYIAPDALCPAAEITGSGEHGNRAELRVSCQLIPQASLEITTKYL